MTGQLDGTVAIVTGASSGIGEAIARRFAAEGASVALLARRGDRLRTIVDEIEAAGGIALAVEGSISDREQAERAIQTVADRYGHIDIVVNNAGLMLLGPIEGADVDGWDRMLATNLQGLLYITHAALPYLLNAADEGTRRVADIVNISSIAARVASRDYGVYNMTKFGVNAFSESLRQEVTQRHVRVGVLEPGGVNSELGSHNTGEARAQIDAWFDDTEALDPADIADGVTYMVTRPRHASVGELWLLPSEQL